MLCYDMHDEHTHLLQIKIKKLEKEKEKEKEKWKKQKQNLQLIPLVLSAFLVSLKTSHTLKYQTIALFFDFGYFWFCSF